MNLIKLENYDAESVAAPVVAGQQRQGDVLLTPVWSFPRRQDRLTPIPSEGIALTSDGHPHIAIVLEGWATWQPTGRGHGRIGWIEVCDLALVEIRHLDPDPTHRHQPLRLAPCIWEVRRQFRYIPAIPVGHEHEIPARTEPAEAGWRHLDGGPVRSSRGWNGLDVATGC